MSNASRIASSDSHRAASGTAHPNSPTTPTRQRSIAMRANNSSAPRLGILWFGIQAVWGPLLGISLQSRSIELVASQPLLAYGRLATTGAIVAAIVQIVVGPWSDARRRR